jgi:hypothetical protein
MSELTPFFSKFGPSFMADSSDFFGDLLLFLAEVVEFDLLSLGRVFFIYCNESNVKRGSVRDHDLVFVKSELTELSVFSSIQ